MEQQLTHPLTQNLHSKFSFHFNFYKKLYFSCFFRLLLTIWLLDGYLTSTYIFLLSLNKSSDKPIINCSHEGITKKATWLRGLEAAQPYEATQPKINFGFVYYCLRAARPKIFFLEKM